MNIINTKNILMLKCTGAVACGPCHHSLGLQVHSCVAGKWPYLDLQDSKHTEPESVKIKHIGVEKWQNISTEIIAHNYHTIPLPHSFNW